MNRREIEVGGVHLKEAHVVHAVLLDADLGFLEHSLGEVDAGDMDRVRKREAGAGADADFEDAFAGSGVEDGDGAVAAVLEEAFEDEVIDSGIGVVDPLDVRRADQVPSALGW